MWLQKTKSSSVVKKRINKSSPLNVILVPESSIPCSQRRDAKISDDSLDRPRSQNLVSQLILTKWFLFALSQAAAAAMLEELLSLLSVSSIASSSISSAVRSGKKAKTGTGTLTQYGMGHQADSISG